MRVAFIGASQFGARCFRTLLALPGVELVGVVTAPERFTISYRPQGVVNVLHADMQAEAAAHGLPVVIIETGMKDDRVFDAVASWRPDCFLVAGWYHLLPRRWRQLAPAYGLHASLLPDYSGGAPLVWAMINGEHKTGITLFVLGDGVDDGPIVGQGETPIRPDDTIATLYARIEEIGLELLATHMPRIASRTAELTPQDESHRRVFPQRGPEDGAIDWGATASDLFNFVRAQTRPYPGAFTTLNGRKLTIWSARVTSAGDPRAVPGEVLKSSLGAVVQTGDAALELLDVELDGHAGGAPLTELRPGTRLGG